MARLPQISVGLRPATRRRIELARRAYRALGWKRPTYDRIMFAAFDRYAAALLERCRQKGVKVKDLDPPPAKPFTGPPDNTPLIEE